MYPTFRSIEELRDMMDKAQHWGFEKMGKHKIMSPYRYIIIAAVRRELTIMQLKSVIEDINKLYE